MYITTFTVSGDLGFPVDMLRHDGCYPASSQDANVLTDSLDAECRQESRKGRVAGKPLFTVTLKQRHALKSPNITGARWSSFGWQVDSASMETRKA